MDRRAFLRASSAALAVSVVGCKTKAEKQSELAKGDLDRVVKLLANRHVDALARALPIAAAGVAAKLDEKADLHADPAAAGAAFVALRDKTDDLRSAKRSYYALVDLTGEIVWVDDDGWKIVGRRISATFPAVKDALDGKAYATGSGRFGGASEDALTFVEAAPVVKGDKKLGALVSAWEAHEAAEDLQRQLTIELAMKTAPAKARVKAKDKLQMAIDQPELWVALFRGGFVYMQEDAPQPLEDSLKALEMEKKTSAGSWTGTFDVMNRGWGGSAQKIPALDAVVAVLRHEP